jgi:hypothetical protein
MCCQERKILGKADLVAVDLIGIQPDAALWIFRVVELRFESIGIIIFADRSHQKPAFGNLHNPGGMGQRRNGVQM